MHFNVNGYPLFAYTAGKAFDMAKPTVVFIHGVLNDHSVWILQSRYLANHGYNVLAIDLPGHGKSAGPCPRTVQDAAHSIIALLDAAGLQQVALAGHSWGSLIALHAASLAPARITHLALLGTAFPMKVSPALLDGALNTPQPTIAMVNTFSHSTLAPPPSALGPGTWVPGGSQALMRRTLAGSLARTPPENVFYLGFAACNNYFEAFEALAQVITAQPAMLFIVGKLDQMTTPKAAKALIDKAPAASVAYLDCGHNMMNEAPEEVLRALSGLLALPAQAAGVAAAA